MLQERLGGSLGVYEIADEVHSALVIDDVP
jgi:hypothetical protein